MLGQSQQKKKKSNALYNVFFFLNATPKKLISTLKLCLVVIIATHNIL